MVVAAIAGYLIGSIPFAVLVGRIKGVDPRRHGDRNAGWWNSRTLMGDAAALLVLVGDVAKGALAAFVGGLLWGPWWTAFVAVLFAMIGHSFPVFAKFRGGRSILTFVGAMLVLATTPTIIALGIGAVSGAVTRKFSYGARIAMFVFPFVQLFYAPLTHVAWTGVMMTFIGWRFFLAYSDARANALPA